MAQFLPVQSFAKAADLHIADQSDLRTKILK
jgi:hypothetical protein